MSEQTIENTNFDYIARLFDFYIEKQNTIEAQQDVSAEILSETLVDLFGDMEEPFVAFDSYKENYDKIFLQEIEQ